ncbi:MAG: hypothetical protein OXU63_13435 [Acidobacteriota bacterium]|nr:hypothetical protein [Acidobacteriota bacterium]
MSTMAKHMAVKEPPARFRGPRPRMDLNEVKGTTTLPLRSPTEEPAPDPSAP